MCLLPGGVSNGGAEMSHACGTVSFRWDTQDASFKGSGASGRNPTVHGDECHLTSGEKICPASISIHLSPVFLENH